MKKLLYFLFVAFTVVGCSKDEGLEYPTGNVNVANHESGTRSLADALQSADEFFASVCGETTRSRAKSLIDVEYLTMGSTRSGESDTLLYLVNYGMNDGFALLGAKETGMDIYAISPTGHLSLNDTVENKALAQFIRNAEVNVTLPGEGPIIGGWNKYSYRITNQVSPMIQSGPASWHQGYPYNKNCTTSDKKQAVVGCGPVAVGILLSYYQWPNKYGNFTFNWNEILNGNEDVIAQYLKKLGESSLLNSTYGEEFTFTALDRIDKAFITLGYSDLYRYYESKLNTTIDDLFSFMKYGNLHAPAAPVILHGIDSINSKIVHVWVLDGYVERTKTAVDSNMRPIGLPTKCSPLLHLVWGWGESVNGYYAYFSDKDYIDSNEMKTANENYTGVKVDYMFKDILIYGGYTHK